MEYSRVVLWVALVIATVVACIGLACGGGTEAPQPTPTPTPTGIAIPPSTITTASGPVFVLKPGAASWVDASEGMDLEAGDSLKTGAEGYAVVVFFEGSVMEVNEHTKLSVVELGMTEAGSTTVSLGQQVGHTVNHVEQLADSASSYDVETPAGVAVVRGTWYDLYVDKKGVSTLDVSEGEACFEAQDKKECAQAGFFITTVPGSPPSKAKSSAPPEPPGPPGGGLDSIPVWPLSTPTPTPTPVPSPSPSPTPTPTPTPTPAATPTPTPAPSPTPSPTPPGIRIVLTWDTEGTDFDAHFIRPYGAYWDAYDDCCWFNMNPDWDGVGGNGTAGDPELDVDDLDGSGPETTTLDQPASGAYEYKVHYFDMANCTAASQVTVNIWINGGLAATYNHTFTCPFESGFTAAGVVEDPEVWNCACIDWPSGNVTEGACSDPY